MSIDGKYLQLLLKERIFQEWEPNSKYGGYKGPCPFCRYSFPPDKSNNGKKRWEDKKCSSLLPDPRRKGDFTFTCLRKWSNTCDKNIGMGNFLHIIHPFLGRRYQSEKCDYTDLTFDKPEFTNLKKKTI